MICPKVLIINHISAGNCFIEGSLSRVKTGNSCGVFLEETRFRNLLQEKNLFWEILKKSLLPDERLNKTSPIGKSNPEPD
jgi:hypothetical protein